MESAISIVFQLAVLIFSVVIHEVSHGLAAHALGDPTARLAGRLTLNPLKHLDPIGSFLVPLTSFFLGGFIIGWAKPVPYNPAFLKTRSLEFGAALVGAAGPAANVALAVAFGLALRGLGAAGLGTFGPAGLALAEIMAAIVSINLLLAVFNLVPIPPLDGSKLLFAILPDRWAGARFLLEQFGFLLLLLFIVYFSGVILPVVSFLFRIIAGSGG